MAPTSGHNQSGVHIMAQQQPPWPSEKEITDTGVNEGEPVEEFAEQYREPEPRSWVIKE